MPVSLTGERPPRLEQPRNSFGAIRSAGASADFFGSSYGRMHHRHDGCVSVNTVATPGVIPDLNYDDYVVIGPLDWLPDHTSSLESTVIRSHGMRLIRDGWYLVANTETGRIKRLEYRRRHFEPPTVSVTLDFAAYVSLSYGVRSELPTVTPAAPRSPLPLTYRCYQHPGSVTGYTMHVSNDVPECSRYSCTRVNSYGERYERAHCAASCTAWQCVACRSWFSPHTAVRSTCATCSSAETPICTSCEEHTFCGTCNRYQDRSEFCESCGYCHTCCRCSIRFVNPGRITFWVPDRKQLVRNPSPRLVALEIECAGTGRGRAINTTVAKWGGAVVHDGSLPSGGFEINTSPAGGDLLLDQMEELSAALAAQRTKVDDSCGLHCHIDCRDLSWADMRRLILLYEKIEPALFRMVPRRRRTNHYCRPCGADYGQAMRTGVRLDKLSKVSPAKQIRTAIRRAVINDAYGPVGERSRGYGTDATMRSDREVQVMVSEGRSNKYNGNRYNALNVHSWFYRGTVECRLHHGTTNRERLINWALLWASIVDTAAKGNDKLIRDLPGGYDVPIEESVEGLMRVAPNDTLREYIQARVNRFGLRDYARSAQPDETGDV